MFDDDIQIALRNNYPRSLFSCHLLSRRRNVNLLETKFRKNGYDISSNRRIFFWFCSPAAHSSKTQFSSCLWALLESKIKRKCIKIGLWILSLNDALSMRIIQNDICSTLKQQFHRGHLLILISITFFQETLILD